MLCWITLLSAQLSTLLIPNMNENMIRVWMKTNVKVGSAQLTNLNQLVRVIMTYSEAKKKTKWKKK